MVCRVSHPGDLPGGTRGHRPERDRFRVRDSHPLWLAVPGSLPLTITFLDSVVDRQVHSRASQLPNRNDCPLSRGSGLASSRFARHYSGNLFCTSGSLDVSVPPVSSVHAMYSRASVKGSTWS